MKKKYQVGEAGVVQGVSKFRTVLPQVLVTTINNLLLMDLSMMLAFPTLVIGDLYGKEGELSLTDEQASWVGSLVYIFQPIGSAVSGILTEPLGRKRSMILVNITPLVGWLLLYFAESVTMLYVANAIMGLGIGFMEAPVLTYVGEISQPHLRGILTAYTGVLAQLGYFMVYMLGAVMHWRPAAAVSASIPIISVLCMMWIPESPLWLLSRGRTEDALKALCWLRGWVQPDAVKHELQELERYAEATKSTETGRWPVLQRLRSLFRPNTFRPLMLVTAFFFFFHASGMSGVRPYMVHVIEEFQMPIDPNWAAVVSAILGLVAISLLAAIVSFSGKRPLTLISIAGCAIPCLVLGTYAYVVIGCKVPSGAPMDDPPANWLPLTMLIILSFSTYFGMGQIPWMYVAEVFPLRSRGLAGGVTAALAYVLYFTASKTYLGLESSLCLYGVFWLYGAFSCVGFVFLYWVLPETEGQTLEEVEAYFLGKKAASTETLDTEFGASRNSVAAAT
ncbi:facilitated trehalose transporter Tret1 [Anabrus simplex]|uniref:facilitated trehalose transporter Tret1 n=1 Tax=Anabrus simplex TaxID=316456 RepID=UPI0035A39D21